MSLWQPLCLSINFSFLSRVFWSRSRPLIQTKRYVSQYLGLEVRCYFQSGWFLEERDCWKLNAWYPCVQVSITKYHRVGGISDKNLFLSVLKSRHVKISMVRFWWESSSRLQTAKFSFYAPEVEKEHWSALWGYFLNKDKNCPPKEDAHRS